jgi:hypothetical protein
LILSERFSISIEQFFAQMALIVLAIGVASCGPQGSPKGAVENYLQAIVEREVVKAASSACSSWEGQARTEARSFEAVRVRLEGMTCELSEQEGFEAIVSCRGEIIADYGGELKNIDLEARRFKVIVESGEWRMCGYIE